MKGLIDPVLNRALEDSGRLTKSRYFATVVQSSRLPLASVVFDQQAVSNSMNRTTVALVIMHPAEPDSGDQRNVEARAEHPKLLVF